jgi:hypothetical protein
VAPVLNLPLDESFGTERRAARFGVSSDRALHDAATAAAR